MENIKSIENIKTWKLIIPRKHPAEFEDVPKKLQRFLFFP